MQRIVDDGRQQVVGHSNHVEVAGKVQIDVFHRYDLRVPAARRPALHSETRPKHKELKTLPVISCAKDLQPPTKTTIRHSNADQQAGSLRHMRDFVHVQT